MRSYIDFYEGVGGDARTRIAREWPGVRKSFLLRSLVIRSFISYIKARGALETSPAASADSALLRSAEREAAALEGEKVLWTNALAVLVRAGIAVRCGDPATAVVNLASAEAAVEASGMSGFAASARYRRGQAIGGNEGRALVESAESWMRAQEIANPARMADLHVPSVR